MSFRVVEADFVNVVVVERVVKILAKMAMPDQNFRNMMVMSRTRLEHDSCAMMKVQQLRHALEQEVKTDRHIEIRGCTFYFA